MNKRPKAPKTNRRKRRGQALTEFALMLPVLLLIVFGIIDFGRVLLVFAMASNSVRDALRQASIVGYVPDVPGEIPFRDCAALRETASRVFFVPDGAEAVTVEYHIKTPVEREEDDDGPPWEYIPTECTSDEYDDSLNNGDILYIRYETQISLITPLISSIVPALDVRFAGQRTIVEDIELHGSTDLSDPDRDTDFDGLPDLWEEEHFGDPPPYGYVTPDELNRQSAFDDPDEDGCSNGCEAVRGSDPWDPDTDGDGLTDGEEAYRYLTDPTKWDTDDDCIVDPDEVNPAFFEGLGLVIEEGLDLVIEPTDARNPDSDGDYLKDGQELGLCAIDVNGDAPGGLVTLGAPGAPRRTNPRNPDTDGDGITDLEEVLGLMIDDGKCFPDATLADTDGDLTDDKTEIELGRNPCVKNIPQLSISDAHVNEGGTATFVVTLIDPVINDLLAPTVSIDYATSDDTDSEHPATVTNDYVAISPALSLEFAYRETSKQITVSTVSDTEDEPDETFQVVLSNAQSSVNPPSVSTATGTINDDDDVPTAQDDELATDEDTFIERDVTENDVDQFPLTNVTIVTMPRNGKAEVISGGLVRYTPNADYFSPSPDEVDSFRYQACDADGYCDIATVVVTVNPVNDAPVANDDVFSVSSGTTNSPLNVLGNDIDVDQDPLTLADQTLSLAPSDGSAATISNNTILFTPQGLGPYEINYFASDGVVPSKEPATVTVYIDRTLPIAGNGTAQTEEELPTSPIDVLGLTQANGNVLDPALVQIVSDPQHGTAAINTENGNIIYTPEPNFHGWDSLSYRTCVTVAFCSNIASVSLEVTQRVDDPPTARDDSAITNEETPVTVRVLSNDDTIDGSLNPLVVITEQSPNGTTIANGDETITFAPSENFSGRATVSYSVCLNERTDLCSMATVTITVRPINDRPLAPTIKVSVDEDTPITITIIGDGGVTDPDGDTLTLKAFSDPLHGTVTRDDNSVIYRSADEYEGLDSFTYQVTDGEYTEEGTVNITVWQVPEAPIANNDTFRMDEDAAPMALDVLKNDRDPEGDPISLEPLDGMTSPENSGAITTDQRGTPEDRTDDRLIYTPPLNFNGTVTFTYFISTPDGKTDEATGTITVDPVNDTPHVVGPGTATVKEQRANNDNTVDIDALDWVADVDTGDVLSLTQFPSHTTHGTLGRGSLSSATPDDYSDDYIIFTAGSVPGNSAVTNTFTYTVCDRQLACVQNTVTVTITK